MGAAFGFAPRLIARKRGQSKYRAMAKDSILLGEVAARGAGMIELRCGRCDRHGRLSVKRLLAEYGGDASLRDIMQAQIGECRFL
jgi:hypothetical protein